jgi:phospholipid/cholesterol/gamma-HCH transport system substrate-binding protein
MTSFRERNPISVGAVSLTVLVLILLSAFYVNDLPIIGGGTTYVADFSEAGGLKANDEARVAGVKMGKVTGVALEGNHVKVTFRVDNAWIGDKTTAAIRIKTLLGQKYLALDPQGSAVLNPSTPIPKDRTLAPYDVQEAFNGLANTVGAIDTQQLAQSFQTLSDTFRTTPSNLSGALNGLSALSRTISSRDQQLAQLLANTHQISQTVADRNAELEKLLGDGNLLLGELSKRKAAISSLLTGTRNLSIQLQGLVADNSAQLKPALDQLDRVTSLLQRNQDNLSQSIQRLAPFVRVFANTLGNGRWFDVFICGLLPPSTGPVNPQGCTP